MAPRISSRSFLAACLLVVAIAGSARADAPPGTQSCSAPSWLECVQGARTQDDVDPCTKKELARLGLVFRCGQSHNDRIDAYWCRTRRLPPPPAYAREGASEKEIDVALDKRIAWEAVRQRELGGIERELTFGTYTEQYFLSMADRRSGRSSDSGTPRPRDPMRFDCFALADKYRRCGLETERCTPYWRKFAELAKTELRDDVPNREALAREAIDAVEASHDAGTVPAVSDAGAPPQMADAGPTEAPKRSCHCTLTPVGTTAGDVAPLILGAALLFARRRSREQPPSFVRARLGRSRGVGSASSR